MRMRHLQERHSDATTKRRAAVRAALPRVREARLPKAFTSREIVKILQVLESNSMLQSSKSKLCGEGVSENVEDLSGLLKTISKCIAWSCLLIVEGVSAVRQQSSNQVTKERSKKDSSSSSHYANPEIPSINPLHVDLSSPGKTPCPPNSMLCFSSSSSSCSANCCLIMPKWCSKSKLEFVLQPFTGTPFFQQCISNSHCNERLGV